MSLLTNVECMCLTEYQHLASLLRINNLNTTTASLSTTRLRSPAHSYTLSTVSTNTTSTPPKLCLSCQRAHITASTFLLLFINSAVNEQSALMPFANGHTMDMTYNMEPLGKLYVSIVTVWSTVLLTGTTFLISRRELPFLRMRNIPLAVSAVATLHVYWILCIMAYVLNGHFPCAVEFWIMSIYLPLGIALFQACNMQILHIADLQSNYTLAQTTSIEKPLVPRMARWRKYLFDLRAENKVRRTMTYIAFGMVVQVMFQQMKSETGLMPCRLPSHFSSS